MLRPIPACSSSPGGLSSNDGNLFMTRAIRILLVFASVYSLLTLSLFANVISPGPNENVMAGLQIYQLPRRDLLITKFGRPVSRSEDEYDLADTWQVGHCRLTISVPKPGAASFVRTIILEGDSRCHLGTGKKIRIGSSLTEVAKAYKLSMASLLRDLGSSGPIEITFRNNSTLLIVLTSDRVVKSLSLLSSP